MLWRLAVTALVLTASTTLMAQWPKYVATGAPTGADGKIDMNAPTPRTADGHPDLSGVWEISRDPNAPPPPARGRAQGAAAEGRGAQGRGRAGQGGGSPFGNIGNSMPDQKAPYQPWAEELVKKRMADNSKDNPDAHCLPMGIMQMDSHPYPKKIIQTPTELLLIYEASGTTVREIFLDGRPLPKKEDVEPWYNGYSVGHWEGDTLVAETTGLMDDGWLDVRGSPLTSEAKLTERFRRINFGYLEIKVTIDDPKAYTKPFDAIVYSRIMPTSQPSEFVCIDKDAGHYIGQKK